MKREVLAEELADQQALRDELVERVAKATLEEIKVQLRAKPAA